MGHCLLCLLGCSERRAILDQMNSRYSDTVVGWADLFFQLGGAHCCSPGCLYPGTQFFSQQPAPRTSCFSLMKLPHHSLPQPQMGSRKPEVPVVCAAALCCRHYCPLWSRVASLLKLLLGAEVEPVPAGAVASVPWF